MVDWRSIPCRVVDWYACGVSRRAARGIHRDCIGFTDATLGPWHGLSLGELADMGERQWRRFISIGDQSVEVIKATIDMAAEGKSITKPDKAPDAYVPKCERTPDDTP